MVKHIVMLSFQETLDDKQKKEAAVRIKEGLERLTGIVPGLISVCHLKFPEMTTLQCALPCFSPFFPLQAFFNKILEFLHGHQNLPGLCAFLRSYNSGITKLIHDSGSSVKSDFKHTLKHSNGGFFLINNKLAGFLKI